MISARETSPYEIRAERVDDPVEVAAIAAVNAAAFEASAHGGLPAALRATPFYRPLWCFVAVWTGDRTAEDQPVAAGTICGHVMVGTAYLDGPHGRAEIPNLSPLAVLPSVQRRGIGTALVDAAAAAVDASGEPFIVLEGSPDYYPRLGFIASTEVGIRIPLPDWAPPAAGQLRKLSGYRPLTGEVSYPTEVRSAFDAVG